MDRTLQDAIARESCCSDPAPRRYELTASGQIKALLLSEQLTAVVSAAANPAHGLLERRSSKPARRSGWKEQNAESSLPTLWFNYY